MRVFTLEIVERIREHLREEESRRAHATEAATDPMKARRASRPGD
jgi:hypothetical protein